MTPLFVARTCVRSYSAAVHNCGAPWQQWQRSMLWLYEQYEQYEQVMSSMSLIIAGDALAEATALV